MGLRYPPRSANYRRIAWNFWTISQPHELGSMYHLLHRNRVAKPVLLDMDSLQFAKECLVKKSEFSTIIKSQDRGFEKEK